MASFPDRVVAIVSAALLEGRIDAVLSVRLLDDGQGEFRKAFLSDTRVMGSLGAKNQLAFALGIYSEDAMKDVRQIAKVRNAFAHKLATKSFDESPIRDHCQNLKLVDRYVFDRDVDGSKIQWIKGLTQQMEDRDRIMAIPRMRFQTTVALLTTGLHLEARVPFEPRKPQF